MIVTKHAVYLHLPKTGGHWVNKVLESNVEYSKQHSFPTKEFLRPHIFSFVRNPWDWHVSLYEFTKTGSEIIQFPSDLSPITHRFSQTTSFDEFLNGLCSPTSEFKTKAASYAKIQLMTNKTSRVEIKNDMSAQATLEWHTSDRGYYELMFNRFASISTKIGKYENIREELLIMAQLSGDLTPSIELAIKETQPINVTKSRDHYRTYYNDKQVELVYNHTRFLDHYNYEF